MKTCPFIKKECDVECMFFCVETQDCKLVNNCTLMQEIVVRLDHIIDNQEGNP